MVVVLFYENNILIIFRRDKNDCIRKKSTLLCKKLT